MCNSVRAHNAHSFIYTVVMMAPTRTTTLSATRRSPPHVRVSRGFLSQLSTRTDGLLYLRSRQVRRYHRDGQVHGMRVNRSRLLPFCVRPTRRRVRWSYLWHDLGLVVIITIPLTSFPPFLSFTLILLHLDARWAFSSLDPSLASCRPGRARRSRILSFSHSIQRGPFSYIHTRPGPGLIRLVVWFLLSLGCRLLFIGRK